MAAITKKSTIGEVLNMNIETARFFMEIGMHCLGCPASQGESIEEACMVHGTNADELVAKKIRAGIVCRLCFFGVLHGKYDFNTAAGLYGGSGAAECSIGGYRNGSRQTADLTAAGWAYCIGYRLGYPFRTAGTCGAQCERA